MNYLKTLLPANISRCIKKSSRGFILIIIFFLFFQYIYSQEGNFYFKNYDVPLEVDHEYFDVVQGAGGRMFFANIYGIVIFNGTFWQLIDTPYSPYSLYLSPFNPDHIYVGTGKGFGVLKKDTKNKYNYHQLSGNIYTNHAVSAIAHSGKTIFFYTRDKIYQTDLSGQVINKIKSPVKEGFSGFLVNNDQVYVNIPGKGLHQYKQDKFILISRVTRDEYILKSSQAGEKSFFVTNNNNIYNISNHSLQLFKHSVHDYLSTNIVSGIVNLPGKQIVISTLSGGCVFINKFTGEKTKILCYQSGLPDDEIFAMRNDNQGGLWICHEYGITRADISLPVSNITAYPGIEGNLYSLAHYNDKIYVTTSEGVYYLTKVKKFEDVKNYIKKEHTTQEYIKKYKIKKNIHKSFDISFFGIDTSNVPDGDTLMFTKKVPYTIEYYKDSVELFQKDVFESKMQRKIYALKSTPYIFKKVKNIDAKCKQLLATNQSLLVASNIGIYNVSGTIGKPVLKDTYVNCIEKSEIFPNSVLIGHEEGISMIKNMNGKWKVIKHVNLNAPVYSIEENVNQIWAGSDNYVFVIDVKNGSINEVLKKFNIHAKYKEEIKVDKVHGKILIFSNTGIYHYNDSLIKSNEYALKNTTKNLKILINEEGYTWINEGNQWRNLSAGNEENENYSNFLPLFQDIKDIWIDVNKNMWVISNNKIYKITKGYKTILNRPYHVNVEGIQTKSGTYLFVDSLEIPFAKNYLEFIFSTPYYLGENEIEYIYYVEGLDEHWSTWTKDNRVKFQYFPSGNYTLHIKAKNILNNVSPGTQIPISIAPPFWKSWWFYLIAVIIIVGLVWGAMLFRIKRIEIARRALQNKVNQATKEIRQQKEEIEQKNKNITSSIEYGQRIQNAILPPRSGIKNALPESFVLFKPRDIVSGDFYWFNDNKEYTIVIVADCTGHGVPGAFMSMIGNTLLNEIIKEMKITEPDEILKHLDRHVKNALTQGKEENDTGDGMDISICKIDKKENKLYFAGARNSMVVIYNDKLKIIEANRFAIGGKSFVKRRKRFTTKELPVEKGTCCYLFSDGYSDQTGGANGKKIKSGRFIQLLNDIHKEKMDQQYNILNERLNKWMDGYTQRDDILVIGFRL